MNVYQIDYTETIKKPKSPSPQQNQLSTKALGNDVEDAIRRVRSGLGALYYELGWRYDLRVYSITCLVEGVVFYPKEEASAAPNPDHKSRT